MHCLIASAGKWKASPERELFEEYRRRLPWPLELSEVIIKTAPTNPAFVEHESAQLLKACAKAERLVALDAGGKTLSSEDIAAQLGRWQDEGVRSLGFLIGGHDGLHESARKKAHQLWSFGRVTWPHLLMRTLLAEQLYRASTILSGHPYHRG